MAEDADLLHAYARRGDVRSLSALVKRHAAWMQALLRGLLPSAADADDAFQDTWMKVIRSAGGYRGGSVRAYLASVARRAAIDRLRRGGRTESLDVEDEEGRSAAEAVPDGAPTPLERFESKATSEDVRREVASLADGPRQGRRLRSEGELSFREIASELGVPLGTALTWMHVATVELKKRLGGAR